jgi:hypothetical protein
LELFTKDVIIEGQREHERRQQQTSEIKKKIRDWKTKMNAKQM